MAKLSKQTIFGIVTVAVLAAVVLVIFLRPRHAEEILPIVGVDTVRTRNVEVCRGNLCKKRPDTLYH